MNEAWEWQPLGEVTMPTLKWNPRTDARSSIRYVDVSSVSRYDLRIVTAAEYAATDAPGRARKIVKSGDTIFATVRPTLRRVAQVPGCLDGEVVSTAFCVLRPNPDLIHPDFLFFAMQMDGVMDEVASTQTGASYPAVRDVDVLSLTVPVPPIPIQCRIAMALNLVRSAILRQGGCEEAATALKCAAMQTLFTRGLRGEAQKETEIGPVPESWGLRPIGEFATKMQYGLSLRGAESGRYTILRMNCQQDGKVLFRDLQFVDVDSEIAETYRVNQNDLLFNRTNSYELVGRTAIVEGPTDAVFASYLVRVSVDEERLSPRFLNHFLNWDTTQWELKKLASRGVSQANISAGKLRNFSILVPSLDEQGEVVAILDAIDRKIDLHRRKRAVLEELFRVLLHKLMTGEIRVGELDLEAISENQDSEAGGRIGG